jgi:hypothetical protein
VIINWGSWGLSTSHLVAAATAGSREPSGTSPSLGAAREARSGSGAAYVCKAVARERSGMRDLQHGLEVVAKLVEVLAGTE